MLVQDSAPVSHRPGAHEVVAGVTQVPAPSHLAAGFCVPAVGQVAAASPGVWQVSDGVRTDAPSP